MKEIALSTYENQKDINNFDKNQDRKFLRNNEIETHKNAEI